MHHALEIQEILLNVFGHCRLPIRTRSNSSDLPALARTCRAFKEPALDVLWAELYNPSPLAQCLPDASNRLLPMNKYSFSRPLTQPEWDILRSYTRRIRVILDFRYGLDWASVRTFLNPPTTEPLFPNLRHLSCEYATDKMHLLHLPLPSLISLGLVLVFKEYLHKFEDSLQLFPEVAPDLRRLLIGVCQPDATYNNFFSSYICRWRNLQDVLCPRVSLNADTIVHLSRMPSLTRLIFTLSATLPDQIASSDSPLIFSNLHDLELHSQSLASVSRLLSQIQLPVIMHFSAFIESCPSKQDVPSFLASLQTSSIGHTIQGLGLVQVRPSGDVRVSEDPEHLLGFQDLQPCMAFSNLRRMSLHIECDEGLTDSEVLTLTSAWPHLEHLIINRRVIVDDRHHFVRWSDFGMVGSWWT